MIILSVAASENESVHSTKQAQQMLDTIVEQMKEAEGVTEQLKEDNQMEWVCCMQNVEARARKIVNHELIYTM